MEAVDESAKEPAEFLAGMWRKVKELPTNLGHFSQVFSQDGAPPVRGDDRSGEKSRCLAARGWRGGVAVDASRCLAARGWLGGGSGGSS